MIENLSSLIFCPVWVAIIIMFIRVFGVKLHKRNTLIFSLIATILVGIFCTYGVFYSFSSPTIYVNLNFLRIENLNFNLGVEIDLMNSFVGLIISIITLIIYVYSWFYMKKDKTISRFYSLMNLFNFSIIGFIFSANMFQTFMCWELMGVISYLLVGFFYNNELVSKDAKQMFLINIIGDISLLFGFISVSSIIVSFSNDISLISLPYNELENIRMYLISSIPPETYRIICTSFVVAGVIKSAQFPINSWLINAMSAPTPVSALIHSSTLVVAGAYLLIKIFPLLVIDSILMKSLVIIGVTTAIICSLFALFQTNIKKLLAYSTSAQFGLVFISIGCMNPIIAIMYIISHALIKSLLFITSGIAIKFFNSQELDKMSELRKHLPIVALCFIIGGLGLSGLGFCGLNAKYLIMDLYAKDSSTFIIFTIISVLTTLYIFKSYFKIFEGKAEIEHVSHKPQFNNTEYNIGIICTIMLSILTILATFLFPVSHVCWLYLICIITLGVSYYLYNSKQKQKKIPIINNLLLNGIYLDKFYTLCETYIYNNFAKIIYFIDEYLVGGFEKCINKIIKKSYKKLNKLQSNNPQTYIIYGVYLFIMIILIFLICYLLITKMFGE